MAILISWPPVTKSNLMNCNTLPSLQSCTLSLNYCLFFLLYRIFQLSCINWLHGDITWQQSKRKSAGQCIYCNVLKVTLNCLNSYVMWVDKLHLNSHPPTHHPPSRSRLMTWDTTFWLKPTLSGVNQRIRKINIAYQIYSINISIASFK